MPEPDLAIFDTHAHLTDPKFASDLEEVLSRARAAGVVGIICAGDNLVSSRQVLELAGRHQGIYAAVGIHPENVEGVTADDILKLREMIGELCCPQAGVAGNGRSAGAKRVAAIGEIGLDYYWDSSNASLQRKIFRRQLQLAAELQLPVLVHDREAHQDTLSILREFPTLSGVVLHCFSGDEAMAEACLEMGCYFGVGGTLTYPKNEPLRRIVASLPLNRLLLETDCPYLAPQPWRGQRNEPAYLHAVVDMLAEVKGISPQEAAAVTVGNADRLLGIDFDLKTSFTNNS